MPCYCFAHNVRKMKYYLIPALSLLLTPLFAQTESTRLPLNDITQRTLLHEERPLPYPPIREADILWEKRVWRVIDTREKINLPFRYPKQPFVTLLTEAVESGRLQAFSTANDEFSLPLSQQEVTGMLYRIDTVPIYDFDTDTEIYQVVKDELNPEDVKRFRIKEHWFFDTRTSTLQVRILGIAPLIEEYDDNGNFRYERPLFWIYYPDARELLAHAEAPTDGLAHSPMSWADIFDMRKFSSYIMKASNIHDERLEGTYTGVDLLQQSHRLEQEIFNFEHDLWSY